MRYVLHRFAPIASRKRLIIKLSSSVMLSSPVIPRLTIVSSITRRTSVSGNPGAAIFFNYAESDQTTLSDALPTKQ